MKLVILEPNLWNKNIQTTIKQMSKISYNFVFRYLWVSEIQHIYSYVEFFLAWWTNLWNNFDVITYSASMVIGQLVYLFIVFTLAALDIITFRKWTFVTSKKLSINPEEPKKSKFARFCNKKDEDIFSKSDLTHQKFW